MTFSAIAWSTAGLFTRLIPLDSATLLVWRGIFGTLGLLAAIVILEGRSALPRFASLGWPGVLYAVVSAAGMLFYITSLTRTTVAHVAVIYATVPFIAAALGWLILRERPSASAVGASLVALAGVGIMVGLGLEGALAGDLLALGMTAAMAVLMVIARRYRNIPTLQAACLSALLSAAVAVPFAVPLAVTTHELGLLALFGIVNSAVGLALFTLGSRYLPAVETALISALDAPLAPIWVWLIFAETPGRATLAGGAIVLAAVLAHVLLSARIGGQRG